jgi:methylmalonyl-CoA/ethylmalonyl-CoA epimerase
MPGILRIDHIGIVVSDLDEAIKWHTNFFGATLISREINRKQMLEEANLLLGDFVFQFMTPISELSPIAKFLEKRGPGIQQIALQVEDIEIATEYARNNGVRVLYETWQVGTNNSKINFLHPKDCGGVLIELVEK